MAYLSAFFRRCQRACKVEGYTDISEKREASARPNEDRLCVLYFAMNVISGVSIIFANKALFIFCDFKFVSALALIHVLITLIGMHLFNWCGIFKRKRMSMQHAMPIAIAYVGYIAGWNLTLNLNTIGFCQLCKVMITPATALAEFLFYEKRLAIREMLAIGVLSSGVGVATITDYRLGSSIGGFAIGGLSIGFSAAYQVWCGSKQKELGVNSMQLMDQYCPWAVLMLSVLVPCTDTVGWAEHAPGTLLGYKYTWPNVALLLLTGVLGLLVSLSTLLAIAATSPVTYAVIAHLKLIFILVGASVLFGEPMPMDRLTGISLAVVGLITYSWSRLQAAHEPHAGPYHEIININKQGRLDANAVKDDDDVEPTLIKSTVCLEANHA